VQEPDSFDPADPLAWRPTEPHAKSRPLEIRDPIIEPRWRGRRVLVHFDLERHGREADPWLVLIDEHGEDATDAEPDVVRELAAAIIAIDAVIDGYLTDEATRSGEGAFTTTAIRTSRFGTFVRAPDLEVAEPVPADDESPPRIAFVAIDLLRVDGQPLLDVPLLERKRILDGLIRQTELVRVTPYTRPPVRSWLTTWKASGFEGAVLKAANSRYVPSSITDQWTVVTKLSAVKS
jgi:bifunctional non-homologous end joining protein LigD